ncbi:hypothetical protein V2J09_021941 [Rumex salicifolius]
MNPQLVWNREWNGLNLIGGGGVREGNRVSSDYCHKEHKACVWWVDRYMKDCLCNLSDEISFGFGLISLLAWAVAEVPQIITNFRTKSSHGVSILFLLTWVFGDIFNLVGCLLEPATLYTVSTVVLLLQSLYYDHFYWGHSKTLLQDEEDEPKRPLNPKKKEDEDDTEGGRGGGGIGMAIPAAPRTSSRPRPPRDCYYFTSARSMAGSSTPPFRSYLSRRVAKSGPSTVALGQQDDDHSSSEDEHHPSSFQPTAARPMPIPRSAAQRVLVAAASLNLPFLGNARLTWTNLLQDASEHSAFGQWLGWMMAAIYMGGRFPQIILNIKRGSVEGLNPLMFIFALVANVSYVASILVRSTEWKKIKANMPWLLDAVVCVALDLFYIYYKYMLKKGISCADDEEEDEKHISVEADQPKPN